MEFLTEFPEMGRRSQMELRKGIDLAFRNFSREYGDGICLLYTSPSPRDVEESRMPSSA